MNDPTAVVMTLDSGDVVEEYFSTRYLAELFMALLPSYVLPDGGRVTSAILSPLVTQDVAVTTLKTEN